MMRWLYSCVVWLVQPLLRAKLRRRAVAEPGYGEAMDERFGYYTQPAEPAGQPGAAGAMGASRFIWVHAVSLGEARAATVLVAQLRLHYPGMRLLLTHGTATGRAQGKALLRSGDVQVWQPWDTVGAVTRFVRHFQPRMGLLIETEVWPNMVATCKQLQVPLCLVNARLSDKSLRQALRLGVLSRPAFAGLHAVWAQTPDDAARLQHLGARVQGSLGNFKFDATPDVAQLAQGAQWRGAQAKPVVMFASSREGEERMLIDAVHATFQTGVRVETAVTLQPNFESNRPIDPVQSAQAAIKNIASDVQWLIVPRHPQRFDEVASLFAEAGFSVSRRSTWGDSPATADVWVGDSLGEMALYFGLADVALLGGSFAPLGGQNLIEAAACGCPVVMGPHTFNFTQAAELSVAGGAAFEVPDISAAVDQARALVQSGAELAHARAAALVLNQAHRGAAERTAMAIHQLLG
jgi:3-deoxy-D-manno-octulosonic-acid transferase